jgi:hypothetical protein
MAAAGRAGGAGGDPCSTERLLYRAAACGRMDAVERTACGLQHGSDLCVVEEEAAGQ